MPPLEGGGAGVKLEDSGGLGQSGKARERLIPTSAESSSPFCEAACCAFSGLKRISATSWQASTPAGVQCHGMAARSRYSFRHEISRKPHIVVDKISIIENA